MKKINTISNVLGITPLKSHLVVFTLNGKYGLHPEAFFVSVENFYTAKSSDTCVIYQTNKFGAVFLVTVDCKTIRFDGEYSVLGAFEFQGGFAVANRQSRSYHYIEPKAKSSSDLGFYFNKSGNINETYLFKRLGDKITLFSIFKREETQTFNIPGDFGIDASLEDGIFCRNEIMYAPLSNGQLLALDINTRELKWTQERVGRTAIFEDKIYCIADYVFKELDANTGEILREENMQGLVNSFGFRPTGEHKVYDEFIFSMASGKSGMVAIYDRKTLKFLEVLKIDEMIPMGTEHLHWHNGKLYVLDFGKTLHVYEKE